MQKAIFFLIMTTVGLLIFLFLSSIVVLIIGLFTANLKAIISGIVVFGFCVSIGWMILRKQIPCSRKEGKGMEKYGIEFDELVKQLIEEGLSEQEAIEKAKEILKMNEK